MKRPNWFHKIIGTRTITEVAQEVHEMDSGATDVNHEKYLTGILLVKYVFMNWDRDLPSTNYEEAVYQLLKAVIEDSEETAARNAMIELKAAHDIPHKDLKEEEYETMKNALRFHL